MVNKSNRIVIGDIANRQAYLEEHQRCELCGDSGNVHHHYKQGKRYLNDNYTIELPEIYSTLCLQHHSIIHTDVEQYDRRLYGQSFNGKMNWHTFEYWHEGKDGRGFAEIVESHLIKEGLFI